MRSVKAAYSGEAALRLCSYNRSNCSWSLNRLRSACSHQSRRNSLAQRVLRTTTQPLFISVELPACSASEEGKFTKSPKDAEGEHCSELTSGSDNVSFGFT
jgi:hypothetical protein